MKTLRLIIVGCFLTFTGFMVGYIEQPKEAAKATPKVETKALCNWDEFYSNLKNNKDFGLSFCLTPDAKAQRKGYSIFLVDGDEWTLVDQKSFGFIGCGGEEITYCGFIMHEEFARRLSKKPSDKATFVAVGGGKIVVEQFTYYLFNEDRDVIIGVNK